jgi:hypothetical protein
MKGNESGYYEASHVYQIQGDLLLALGEAHHVEALACLERALHIARHQGARPIQLRAAVSLADPRLVRDPTAARELLAEAIDGFAPEVDIPELRHARQRLAELA